MRKIYLTTLCTGAILGAGLSLVAPAIAKKSQPDLSDLPAEELQTLAEVYGRIKSIYVDDVDSKELIQDAIRGMISGLDPHSTYLDKEEFKDMQVSTTGKFGGLGIEVTMEDGFVKVVSPIDDTPAQRAGIQAGDLIIKLDDTPVKGLKLSEAVDIMRGEPGTDIELTIVREGETAPITTTIKRAIIKVRSVRNRMLDDGYGYVRISQFQDRTTDDTVNAIKALKKENGGSLDGLVLDLRNNPGGLLTSAVGVSDAFLKDGDIVSIRGRNERDQVTYSAESAVRGDVTDGVPVVVLINGGSASASEIVSGALQDHRRAVIMGRKSFGKGSVQTINPMRHGDAVKLTTARYYTPSGRTIQATGIEPDIKLSRVKVERIDNNGFEPISESQLQGHLEGENEQKKTATTKGDALEKSEDLINKDFQLYEALNLLKGLKVVNTLKK